MRRRTTARGFTLIELMVAIAVMAMLALMSWRGLEGMSRAQAQNRERGDAVLTLQTALSQWGADLDAAIAIPQTVPIDWDGRVLRITRRGPDLAQPVVHVVAWTVRPGADGRLWWMRWQSAAFTSRADWRRSWERASTWAQDGGSDVRGADVALMPVQGWQPGYFRDNSWGPAVNAESLGAETPLPDGVR
ncbi:MAG: prepilin-type N-terminal cleavage/methylation domain-containing protein, partial [Cytophagaceae bacterium]